MGGLDGGFERLRCFPGPRIQSRSTWGRVTAERAQVAGSRKIMVVINRSTFRGKCDSDEEEFLLASQTVARGLYVGVLLHLLSCAGCVWAKRSSRQVDQGTERQKIYSRQNRGHSGAGQYRGSPYNRSPDCSAEG